MSIKALLRGNQLEQL